MSHTATKKKVNRKLVVIVNGKQRCVITERLFWDKKADGVNIKVVEILEENDGHVDT